MMFPIFDVKCNRSAHCRADRVDENITYRQTGKVTIIMTESFSPLIKY